MDKIRHVLFRSWFELDTLEDRIYHIILDVAVFATVITLAAEIILRFPVSTIISPALILLYLIIIQFITMRYPNYSRVCRILLVVGMNLVLFPVSLFVTGGIYGGTILFFLCGLLLCAILLGDKWGTIAFLISLLVMEASITISITFPQLVQDMSERQHLLHIKVSLILAGLAIYSIMLLILRSYYTERDHNEQLMGKLRDLSVKDTLTGLFNRGELFRRLEVMYNQERRERTESLTRTGHYIAMFDVDDFKKFNDTYGHSFGDAALTSVSEVLGNMVHTDRGELTSRYGGEEFVCILAAESMDEAFRRIDEARQTIADLRWEELPDVHVTISGGLISCEDHPDLTQAMHDVDVLLYQAKAAGKNQICVEE